MAIPKSTFVMGVVTLGLFGVAIYKTASGQHARDRAEYNESDDYDAEDEDNDALERYAAEQDALAREKEAERRRVLAENDAKKAQLSKLYAAEVALPGELFRGATLDEAFDNEVAERAARFTSETGIFVRSELQGRFAVRSSDEDVCRELHTRLATVWGTAATDNDGVEIWTNKLERVRASFRPSSTCELVFEKYDEPVMWLNRSGSSTVPMTFVGKSATFVAEAVDRPTPTPLKRGDDVIQWWSHGLGAGAEPTTLQAFLANGKVTHVIATTKSNVASQDALEQFLRAEFGKPQVTENPHDKRLEWRTHKLVVMFADDDSIEVMIGNP